LNRKKDQLSEDLFNMEFERCIGISVLIATLSNFSASVTTEERLANDNNLTDKTLTTGRCLKI
jgi:hypothetical protein